MAGPSWLAGGFAAVMILTALYSAGRLAVSPFRGRATELDADVLHVIMGVAMAGMLVSSLNPLPRGAWAAVFGAGAIWFGWRALRARSLGTPGGSRCRYPVPHLVECIAMLYMLLPPQGSPTVRPGAGMAMPGMGASASPAASFPALALVLALFMLGYIVWTTDRLTSLVRAPIKVCHAAPAGIRQPRVMAIAAAARPPRPARAGGTRLAPAAQGDERADGPMLAPKLAACSKIAMSIAMGYMLILML